MRMAGHFLHTRLAAAFVAAVGLIAVPATASAGDETHLKAVAGTWKGPGEIVAGKYKGTKFNCALAGNTEMSEAPGLTMEGSCRVGIFSQKMSATITKAGRSYKGRFLEGAAGNGLDVVSGKVSQDRFVFALNRKQLNGAMVASLANPDTMNVTISVKVGDELVPVIGMTLARDRDPVTVGSIR